MTLELARDRRQHLLAGRRLLAGGTGRQVRHLAQVEPAVEPVRRCRVEHRPLGRDLLRELAGAPLAVARADEADAVVRDLLQPVDAPRRCAAERGPVREPEREDLLAGDAERPGGTVDRDAAHGNRFS
jgi:hypothetical protein